MVFSRAPNSSHGRTDNCIRSYDADPLDVFLRLSLFPAAVEADDVLIPFNIPSSKMDETICSSMRADQQRGIQRPPVHLSIHPSARPSVRPSICLCPSVVAFCVQRRPPASTINSRPMAIDTRLASVHAIAAETTLVGNQTIDIRWSFMPSTDPLQTVNGRRRLDAYGVRPSFVH